MLCKLSEVYYGMHRFIFILLYKSFFLYQHHTNIFLPLFSLYFNTVKTNAIARAHCTCLVTMTPMKPLRLFHRCSVVGKCNCASALHLPRHHDKKTDQLLSTNPSSDFFTRNGIFIVWNEKNATRRPEQKVDSASWNAKISMWDTKNDIKYNPLYSHE